MSTIILKDIVKKEKGDRVSLIECISCLLGDFPKSHRRREIYSWWGANRNSSYEICDDLVPLLYKVNREIKNPDVPSNYKNKFYKYKTKYLKLLLSSGKIENILDSGNYWKFVIGSYSFHQIKSNYKNREIISSGHEDYVSPDLNNLPEFSMDDYKTCLLSIYVKLREETTNNGRSII